MVTHKVLSVVLAAAAWSCSDGSPSPTDGGAELSAAIVCSQAEPAFCTFCALCPENPNCAGAVPPTSSSTSARYQACLEGAGIGGACLEQLGTANETTLRLASDCFLALTRPSCSEFSAGSPTSCDDFGGVLTDRAQSCDGTHPELFSACGTGYCQRSQSCPGACARYQGLGDPCTPPLSTIDQRCGPESRCVEGTCARRLVEGEACVSAGDCALGLSCEAERCTRSLARGTECHDVAPCAAPFACVDHDADGTTPTRCGPRLEAGAACNRARQDCGAGLGCADVCVALPRPPSACRSGRCVEGAWCNDGACAELGITGAACSPMVTSCAPGLHCAADRRCAPRAAAGASCSSPAGCRSGVCQEGRCGCGAS